MKFPAMTAAAALLWTTALPVLSQQPARTPAKAASAARTAAPKEVPPFSGTWFLNSQRSKLAKRIPGESKAVIQYDGKTWHMIHSHQESPDDLPEVWQVTYTVNSPKLQVQTGEDITFRSRLRTEGRALVMEEWGVTGHGQKIHNVVRYTLEDNNNTLMQVEASTGPLGTQKSIYVLEREKLNEAPAK